jgi:hypothetical protein
MAMKLSILALATTLAFNAFTAPPKGLEVSVCPDSIYMSMKKSVRHVHAGQIITAGDYTLFNPVLDQAIFPELSREPFFRRK